MALIRGRNWWWDSFKNDENTSGSITLSNGYSETLINLNSEVVASKIYTCVVSDGVTVCLGDVDKVGVVQTGPNSFVLYADIKSITATVFWLVDLTE